MRTFKSLSILFLAGLLFMSFGLKQNELKEETDNGRCRCKYSRGCSRE